MKDMMEDERALTAELDELRRIHAVAKTSPPPAMVDEHILVQSRAAVRTGARPRSWWIPASVAATALIALSLVMRIEHEAATTLPEAGVMSAPKPAARSAGDSAEATAPVVTGQLLTTVPAAPDAERAPAPAAAEPAGKRDVPPRQAMPRMASPAASEQDALGSVAVKPAAAGQASSAALADNAATAPARKAGRTAPAMTPEAWLAKIEALEAAGRTEDAARERALLEQAYPGWLESRQGPH